MSKTIPKTVRDRLPAGSQELDAPGSPAVGAPERTASQCLRIPIGVLATAAAVLLVCTGCAATKEVASTAAGGVEEAFSGLPEDPGLRRTVIIDPGYQPLNRVLKTAEAVIGDSADAGHRLSIHLVDGGNASSLRDVDLSSANDGDLRREARNGPGRREEAERNAEAVTDAVRAELADFSYTGSGADLFGAIDRVTASRIAPEQVVLITGGGVHQTAELNLVADYQQVAELAQAIPLLVAPGTELVVIGVADFTGAETTPTAEFTDAVDELWEAACEAWQFHECILATDVAVLATLGG